MDRRNALKSSLLLAGLSPAAESQSGGTSGAQFIHRTDSLFDQLSTGGRDLISAVVPVGGVLATLHGDLKSRRFAVTGTTPAGSREWHFPLPEGYYSGLAYDEHEAALRLYALYYRDGGKARRDCILQLGLGDGTVGLVGQLSDRPSSNGR